MEYASVAGKRSHMSVGSVTGMEQLSRGVLVQIKLKY